MRKIVLDTSIYIPMLRKGKMPGGVVSAAGALVYLSAVVAQELYAGAIDQYTIRALDALYNVFEKNGRLVVPKKGHWISCGKILSQIGNKQGFESIKRGRLVNDVLIALSCKEENAVLLTSNEKDFALIHEFLPFQFFGI